MHAVALTHERLVDLHIAGCEVTIRRCTQCLLVRSIVHPGFDPRHLLVAQLPILLSVTGTFITRSEVWAQSIMVETEPTIVYEHRMDSCQSLHEEIISEL